MPAILGVVLATCVGLFGVSLCPDNEGKRAKERKEREEEAKQRVDQVRSIFNKATKVTVAKHAASLSKVLADAHPSEYPRLAGLIVQCIRTTSPEVMIALLSNGSTTERYCSLLESMPRLHFHVVQQLKKCIQATEEKEVMDHLGHVCSRVLCPVEVDSQSAKLLIGAKSKAHFIAFLTFLCSFAKGMFQTDSTQHLGPKNRAAFYRILISLKTIEETNDLRLEVSAVFCRQNFRETHEAKEALFLEDVERTTTLPKFPPSPVPPFARECSVQLSPEGTSPLPDAPKKQQLSEAELATQKLALEDMFRSDVTQKKLQEEDQNPSVRARQRMAVIQEAAFFSAFPPPTNQTETLPDKKPLPPQLKLLIDFIKNTRIPSLQEESQNLRAKAQQEELRFLKATDKEEGMLALDAQDAMIKETDALQETEMKLVAWMTAAEETGDFPTGATPLEVLETVQKFNEFAAQRCATRAQRQSLRGN